MFFNDLLEEVSLMVQTFKDPVIDLGKHNDYGKISNEVKRILVFKDANVVDKVRIHGDQGLSYADENSKQLVFEF